MATSFNDANAWIHGSGNFSLGAAGSDDGQAHPTYGWAKNDVSLFVPASELVGDTLPALTYATGNLPVRILVASTTHKVTVPMPQGFIRSFAGTSQGPASPHGILVKSMALCYKVTTADLTSITGEIDSAPLAAGAAIPTVTAMTTTVAGGTLTQAAAAYLLVVTVTTPAFISVADSMIWGFVTIVTPASSLCQLMGASWRVAYAMY